MNDFDFNTISNFDKHISSSINGYELLDYLIMSISEFYSYRKVVDLGCTTGRLASKIETKYKCETIGYDITDAQFINNSEISLFKQDITDPGFLVPEASLILSVFTLQFIDQRKRMNILDKVFSSLDDNGAFIFCEKEIEERGCVQEIFTFSNYDYKRNNFTEKEILNKEKSIRRVMKPLTAKKNKEMLRSSGLDPYIFFKSLGFTGYLCIKS
jgi:tRNA (cmo5U34)-methyltransferase